MKENTCKGTPIINYKIKVKTDRIRVQSIHLSSLHPEQQLVWFVFLMENVKVKKNIVSSSN